MPMWQEREKGANCDLQNLNTIRVNNFAHPASLVVKKRYPLFFLANMRYNRYSMFTGYST